MLHQAANPGGLYKIKEHIMRTSSLLRTATLALSLIALTGVMSTAFAATSAPQAQQSANTGIYDSPDFVVPLNNVY